MKVLASHCTIDLGRSHVHCNLCRTASPSYFHLVRGIDQCTEHFASLYALQVANISSPSAACLDSESVRRLVEL